MSFYKMHITSLVNQGSLPAFIAGSLGSQLISLGPDDANMKHEDIMLCRNEQGQPIKLGQGGFGKVSSFSVFLDDRNKKHMHDQVSVLLQVYKAMKCGVQPIAVKVVHGTDKRQLSAFAKVSLCGYSRPCAKTLSTVDHLQASAGDCYAEAAQL